MSVQTEIDRISTAVQNAHLKVIEKGGTSAAPYLVANLAEAIGTIPEATEPTLQSKTVKPTNDAQTVKPDSGYDGLSQVTVNAINLNDGNGRMQSGVTDAGVVVTYMKYDDGSGEKTLYTGSLYLPTQAAQTITPGTTDQTIPMRRYLTGDQTIKGDANLVAGNIKSGVSIFGVAGSLTEGEDVTAETTEYTELLTGLEAAVEALPDAGGEGTLDTGTIIGATTMLANPGEESTYYYDLEVFANKKLVFLQGTSTEAAIVLSRLDANNDFEVTHKYQSDTLAAVTIADSVMTIEDTTSNKNYKQFTYYAA